MERKRLLIREKSAANAGRACSPPADIAPLRPTRVYDSYWRLAVERQAIFFKRLANQPPPWTDDPVLRTYKFTNAYRASDRVSQYLIRHVLYPSHAPRTANEVFFRIMLFKVFNRIDTWELLERSVGALTYADYSFKAYDRILEAALTRGESIYSGAYIMPTGRPFGYERKHQNHLALIERMIDDEVPHRLSQASTMQGAFDLLLSYPTIGDFLAYQFVTDLNYSELLNFSESEFVVPGPGAIGGIRKCFADRGGLNDAEIIRFMVDRQELEFARLGLQFQDLWGRRLQLIDCQNLFCEVDKYARVAHPEFNQLRGRSRIKQRFHMNPKSIDYRYPPKWRLDPGRSTAAALKRGQPINVPALERQMNFNEYQVAALETDRKPRQAGDPIIIKLLGLAGETGELLSEYKKFLRDGDSHLLFRDRFEEELGDLLWYLANVATSFEIELSEIATKNLKKARERWGPSNAPGAFDADFPLEEQLPRQFKVDFATVHSADGKRLMKAFYRGEPFGNDLTDNAHEADGYRFHDVFHITFAAVLRWSPITRKLLDRKRRSNAAIDEVEDGGRAAVIEEAISALIFAYAKEYNWLDGKASVGSELLRIVKNMTQHLEVRQCTTGDWETAIVQGFQSWRVIKSKGGGTLAADLEARTVTVL
jgi:NTP pyrophosphatase (non-canonical NTP hydrolase)